MDKAAIVDQRGIALNFLPLDPHAFSFTVYRKPLTAGSVTDGSSDPQGIKKYRLPQDGSLADGEYQEYLVSLISSDGYEPFEASSSSNNYLTLHVLLHGLAQKCREVFGSNHVSVEEGFQHRVEIITSKDYLGNEVIWLEPYFLNATSVFGILIGYRFRVAEGHRQDRRVLQRSLSLGRDGRENKNYYADMLDKLKDFINRHGAQVLIFETNSGTPLMARWPLLELKTERLETKQYVFANGRSGPSQFIGVKTNGPLKQAPSDPLLCFIYREQDKPMAIDMYYALRGERYATFPGMNAMFGFPLEKRHILGLAIEDFSESSAEGVISQISDRAEGRATIPLITFPWSRTDPEGEDYYYRWKHRFLVEGIPTQFVSLQNMNGKDGLKWSIANIGLGVFSKLGGQPWRLVPSTDRCLIIGIGQAHRYSEKRISRYFAYSVLSDSSGLYNSMKVLSRSADRGEYLGGLTRKIAEVIADASGNYDSFAIHTPFKLRRDETVAINDALGGVSDTKRIVVLKFNDESKYFGFASWNNSKVPYESSYVELGHRQYLVWFEGLQYHDPTVKRRIAHPMHVEFAYPASLEREDERRYLQDALNLSGANWRGFNAKTLPVSVHYARLVARYIQHFDRLGLAELDIENLNPWFL